MEIASNLNSKQILSLGSCFSMWLFITATKGKSCLHSQPRLSAPVLALKGQKPSQYSGDWLYTWDLQRDIQYENIAECNFWQIYGECLYRHT